MFVIRWLLSLFFIIQMYVVMAILAIVFLPLVALRRDAAFAAVHTYCRYVRWSARLIVGLDSEIRGQVPTQGALIASKHQSFFDIIMIVSVCPRPRFIMKKELLWVPIVGFYAKCIRCVPVDRGKRGAAIQKMLKAAEAGKSDNGQLIIYPQGTRVAPGAKKSYKIGAGLLYDKLNQPCVPAATNVGVFWPRHGIMRKSGLAVVEFLEPIEPGMTGDEFMKTIETRVEAASNDLMREAGFDIPET